jgi:hypothetical protein
LPFQNADSADPVPGTPSYGSIEPTTAQNVGRRQVAPPKSLALPLPGAATEVARQVRPFQTEAAARPVISSKSRI